MDKRNAWTPAKISAVVPDATRTVRCLACGFGHDSAAATDLEALDDVAAMHDPNHAVALRIQWSSSIATPVSLGGMSVSDDAASLASVSRADSIVASPSA